MNRSEANTKPANSTAQGDATPQHRVHSPNEPLPGARDDRQPSEFSQSDGSRFHEEVADEQGQNAFNSERPLDVRPTQIGRFEMPSPIRQLVLSELRVAL
jgi:hypothetical protein